MAKANRCLFVFGEAVQAEQKQRIVGKLNHAAGRGAKGKKVD